MTVSRNSEKASAVYFVFVADALPGTFAGGQFAGTEIILARRFLLCNFETVLTTDAKSI